ncbi:GUN4 domain-containing protein [Nostoc punctiforme]|uniref:GUN4 domain protein n=1 Tax=Nostoc punctiforme (strain ATCC 29133 / PCC 73102) TaxID=63737 RepID=B2JB18_NOSP7|nr:GUN4 domain-containing protein [Nostoc punctiforme]ACC85122.1 GUN4 domain protein [Nostoc punctiforme PCC 73102]
MKILHISLKEQGKDYVSLRYFWDNPSDYKEHKLSVAEIKQLGDRAETDYYTRLPVDYSVTGQALYNWLDKSDRLLANALNHPHQQGLVIAIATDKGLAHLPWELLHDGKCFLVEKTPPIIPVRWMSNGQPIVTADNPQNRPLNVLFMATSPLGVEPELDYEAEEGKILSATKRTPVNLRVEESGCLNELSYVVREYEAGYFDVFHLTGHATVNDKTPCFLTEDEYGNRVDSSTDAIAKAMMFRLPALVFLSGCRTGYSSEGAVPSMAEKLLSMGATAVIGWGERVKDTDATAAAGQLYWELSQGGTLTQAMASTYQKSIEQKVPDWHKLRLYAANTLPGTLVTSLRTPRRKQLPKPSNEVEFRDDEKRLRVTTRENFVGRRRQLQNCLRTLKTDFDKVGILIHGMGGWGKSSIASRLWDRLPEHEKILWWQQIDESYLIKKLKDKLINPKQLELIPDLENSKIPLKSRLIYLFTQLAETGEKSFLLILDDFEWNLEPREGQYVLKAEVAPILEALVQAIQSTGTNNRIIITCRYDFDSDLLDFLYKQGLEPFKKAELTKKVSRLENFSSGKIPDNLRERALNLADGNPRLLEFLNDELSNIDVETRLTKLEQSPELWKAQIIWEELYRLIDELLQKILSYCLVYDIPVPMVVLEAACDQLPNYQQQLQTGLKLGLIEVSPEPDESKRLYRVSRIITHIIPTIRLPEAPKVYSLYQKAHERLHQLWGNKENESQEKWQEIFRLKFANKENPERFRQGFDEMLAVQCNLEADKAFESELRKVADDLVKDGLCTQLENYLQQKQWQKADEETAWIFYQVMVKENYEDWEELLKDFPCETLREINRLWLISSNNRFGISIQAEIYQSLGSPRYDVVQWDAFGERIGWKQLDWLSNNELMEKFGKNGQGVENLPSPPGALPVKIYTRIILPKLLRGGSFELWRAREWGGFKVSESEGLIFLFSRAKTCRV